MEIAAGELTRAVDDTYGAEYFGHGRDPGDREGLSGYERYDRETSNADVAADIIVGMFPATRTLDVGCATGFVVEALREKGVDGRGVDVSSYAISHAAPGARGHIQRADVIEGLPFADGEFELVSVLETLEHLPPEVIPRVLPELRRICRGWLVATIPSFGPNDHGPSGWLNAKVKEERLEHYQSLGDDYDGPVAYDDLFRDARGEPIEGHLTIASFRWWTARFAEAGFLRCGDTEGRIHPIIAAAGLSDFWNLYVFRIPSAPEPPPPPRT
jgi:SAM-dependent methyltransferase